MVFTASPPVHQLTISCTLTPGGPGPSNPISFLKLINFLKRFHALCPGEIIIITIYFKNVYFFHAQLGSDVFPYMRLLHISLNTTNSECKPSSSISSFTHSFQVILPLPAHFIPATTTFLQADTQLSPLLRSTCSNHLNLPCLPKMMAFFTKYVSCVFWTLHLNFMPFCVRNAIT